MVLATLIRAEMAYPGIGILAGDNSQYLSIVSAHGVIMVFFMAMPLLFGFFTNFLLPTQLGVHDVAFPRMNSAAFWFLPASLIVLAQLVCVDRRYQRMNCFNIRELQSLVRRRFFFELLDNNVFNKNLNHTIISERFKNNNEFINKNNNMIYNFYNLYLDSIKTVNLSRIDLILLKSKYNFNFYTSNFNLFFNNITKFITFIYYFLGNMINININSVLFLFINIFKDINSIFSIFLLKFINNNINNNDINKINNTFYAIKYLNNLTVYTFMENYSNVRYLQFNNPSFVFKVKTGNYLPEKTLIKNFDHIINTLNFKTIQNKKSL